MAIVAPASSSAAQAAVGSQSALSSSSGSVSGSSTANSGTSGSSPIASASSGSQQSSSQATTTMASTTSQVRVRGSKISVTTFECQPLVLKFFKPLVLKFFKPLVLKFFKPLVLKFFKPFVLNSVVNESATGFTEFSLATETGSSTASLASTSTDTISQASPEVESSSLIIPGQVSATDSETVPTPESTSIASSSAGQTVFTTDSVSSSQSVTVDPATSTISESPNGPAATPESQIADVYASHSDTSADNTALQSNGTTSGFNWGWEGAQLSVNSMGWLVDSKGNYEVFRVENQTKLDMASGPVLAMSEDQVPGYAYLGPCSVSSDNYLSCKATQSGVQTDIDFFLVAGEMTGSWILYAGFHDLSHRDVDLQLITSPDQSATSTVLAGESSTSNGYASNTVTMTIESSTQATSNASTSSQEAEAPSTSLQNAESTATSSQDPVTTSVSSQVAESISTNAGLPSDNAQLTSTQSGDSPQTTDADSMPTALSSDALQMTATDALENTPASTSTSDNMSSDGQSIGAPASATEMSPSTTVGESASATGVVSQFYIYATNSSSSADETSLETESNSGFLGFNMAADTYEVRNYTLDSTSGHMYDVQTSKMLVVWPGHGNNIMLASSEDMQTNNYVPITCTINGDETLSCSYQQAGVTFSEFYIEAEGSSQYLNIGQSESNAASSSNYQGNSSFVYPVSKSASVSGSSSSSSSYQTVVLRISSEPKTGQASSSTDSSISTTEVSSSITTFASVDGDDNITTQSAVTPASNSAITTTDAQSPVATSSFTGSSMEETTSVSEVSPSQTSFGVEIASSTTPSYSSSTTPSYSNSTTPSYSNSTTPSYSNSTTPSYSNSTTPSYSDSTSIMELQAESTDTMASSTIVQSNDVSSTLVPSAISTPVPFYITDTRNSFAAVSPGQDEASSFVVGQDSATSFYIDETTGYLIESGLNTTYAANRNPDDTPEVVYFSTV
ncbi:hypothetical protein KCU67_g7899, partial [Aureobasidium melanogenum]